MAENIYAEIDMPDRDLGQFNKTAPEGWIRKSFEQLALQQTLENRNKMAPRSKSLDTDLRSNYEDSDNEEFAATRESECDLNSENATRYDSKCENATRCQLANCDSSKSDLACCDEFEEQIEKEKKKIRSKKNSTEEHSKR